MGAFLLWECFGVKGGQPITALVNATNRTAAIYHCVFNFGFYPSCTMPSDQLRLYEALGGNLQMSDGVIVVEYATH